MQSVALHWLMQWVKMILLRKRTSNIWRIQRFQSLMIMRDGAACTESSRCKRTSKRKSPLFNLLSRMLDTSASSYHGFTVSLMQLRCSGDMQSFVCVSRAALSFILSFAFQDIVILQMGSLTLQKLLSHSVLIHAMSSRFASFSRRHRDILMRTGMCYLRVRAHMRMCSVR
jgi:hypothetical protein